MQCGSTGEPADACAVPGYLLFGDSLLDRVNAAVNKDKELKIVALGRRLVDVAGAGRRRASPIRRGWKLR